MIVVSDTTTSNGLVGLKLPLIILGYVIHSFPRGIYVLRAFERIFNDLHTLWHKLSLKYQPVNFLILAAIALYP